MKFHITNGLGVSLDDPPREWMWDFLLDLDPSDEEHGAVWVTIENGDSLEWNLDGRLVYDRNDGTSVRHLCNISREMALELWIALTEERFDELERHPWQLGNGYVLTPEREAEIAAWQLAIDRKFYDVLGPENPDQPCRHSGCVRGSIRMSVFCRPHHFISIKGKQSPFDD